MKLPFHRLALLASAALRGIASPRLGLTTFLATSLSLSAQSTLYWEINSGTWDTTTGNWSEFSNGSGASFPWSSGTHTVFSVDGKNLSYAITVAGTLNPSSINFALGTVTLSGGELTSLDSIIVGTGLTANIGTVLSGTQSITKSGTGDLVLTGTNTHTGDITISAGTLTLGNSTASGSVAGNITNNSTLVFNRSDDTIFNGVVSGTGGLIQDGYILRLSAPQTYTGPTTVKNGGFLVLSTTQDQGLSAATTVDLETGSLFDFSNRTLSIAGLTGSGRVYSFVTSGLGLPSNNGHLTVNTAADTTSEFSGVLGGASANDFALTKTGAGTQVLSGVNTHTGVTTISGGTLSIAADSALGTAPGSATAGHLSLDGGTLATSATFTLAANRGIALGASGGTFNTASATTLTYGGIIAGSGSLTKSSTGNITLSGANTYSGDTTISGGTLQLDHALALQGSTLTTATGLDFGTLTSATLGGLSGSQNLALTNGSATAVALNVGGNDTNTAYSGILSGAGSLTKSGSGNLTFSGSNTYSGGTTVSGGTLTGTSTSIQGNVTNNAAVTFDQASNGTYTDILSGSGSFTKSGAGNVTLSGANTYSGTTTVSGGTLTLGHASALGDSVGAVDIASGATLDLNDHSVTLPDLDGAGAIDLGSATLTTGDANNHALSDLLSGSGNLTKSGSGNLSLSGANTYSGTTTISAGTLTLGHASALGDSAAPVDIASGAILDLNDQSVTLSDLDGVGAIDLGSATLTTGDTNNHTLSGIVSGTGALTKVGSGNLSLSGDNTYSGDTTISAGTLTLGHTNALQGSTLTTATGLSFGDLTAANLGGLSGSQNLALTNGSAAAVALNVGANNASTAYSGILSDTGSLTKSGSGTLTLSGANTYSGDTTISAGTLTLGHTNALQGSTLTTATGLSFGDLTAANLGGLSGSQNLALTNGSTAAVALNVGANNASTAYSGILSGSGSLTKAGSGNMTLSGANTYSGDTTISAGTLTGSTASMQGNITNNASVVFDQSTGGSYAGILSGSGSVAKSGSGNVTLFGANTYSGTTTISAGTLSIGADSGLGSAPGSSTAGHLTLNGGTLATNATFTLAANRGLTFGASSGTLDVATGTSLTYDGSISSAFTKAGSGTLKLTKIGGPSNDVAISAGTLLLEYDTGDGSFANYSGTLSGAGNLIINLSLLDGLALNGANTFTGTTTLNGGTIVVTADSGLGAAPTTVTPNHLTFDGGTLRLGGTFTLHSNRGILLGAGGGTIEANAGSLTYGGIMAGSGSLAKSGSGTLTLSGANTYSGGTTISSGTLTGNTTSVQGNITNNASLFFDQASDGTYAGVISGSGVLTKSGAGNLTLSGANTYSGTTNVSAGTLTGTTSSLQGNVTNNTAIVFDQASTGTYAGVLSGSGSLTKSGSGNVTLSAANTFSGNTTISNGVITLGDTNALQNSTAELDGGTLNFSSPTSINLGGLSGSQNLNLTNGSAAAVALNLGGNDASTAYSGIVSGSGSLTKAGNGTLTLSGANTYSGGTTVSAGILTGTSSSLQGNITNNAAVVFDQASTGTYAGILSGSGSLTKSGSGNVTLSGANNYSGGTTVSTGTLSGTSSSLQGNITNNAAVVFDQASIGTYADVLSGSGSLTKSGSGILTLSGANTYSGGTTVSSGTLTGTSSSLQGNITNNAAVVFDQASTGTYAGILSGSGSLTKAGSGILTLNGANTYSGGTTLSAGTLALASSGAIGSQGNISFNGGTLQSSTANTTDYSTRFSTADNQAYSLDTNGQNVTLASNLTSSGGSLTKSGSGNLTLSGANNYSGGTTVSAGALTGTSSSLQGNVTNNAAVTFDQTSNGSYTGVISGTGSLTKSGSGNLTLSSNNTHSGGTTISAGTLTLGAGGASGTVTGNITNDGTLVFDRSGDYTFGSVVSGSGGVTHDGAILRLSSAQTYTGSTTLKTGATLVLPSSVDQGLSASTIVDLESTSILDFSNRALTLAGLTGSGTVYSFGGSSGHLTLDIGTGQTNTFAGALGTSNPNFALTKTSAGTLSLSGANTYSGTTTISAGSLQIGDGGSSGSLGTGPVVNNAALLFNRSGALAYAGNISGTGSLTVSGPGTITLSGDNNYTGNTAINAGTLSLASTNAFYGGTIDNTNAAKISVASGAALGLGVGGVSSFSASNISTIATNASLVAGAKLALDTTNATGGTATLNDFGQGSTNLQKIGTGTLALTGTTSGTGTMDVIAGTLLFSAPTAFYGGTINATNASKVSVSADATLNLGIGSASSFSSANITTISQNTSLAVGAHLGLDTTNAAGGTTTLDNLNVGSTGFAKTGTGSLTLTGTTTNTGSTTINGGSLILGSDALLGAAPGTATAGHLTLDGGTLATNSNFSLHANRGVALGSSGATFDTSDATTLTAAGDIAGTGTLTKTGTGILTLATGSASTGTLTVSVGTLNVGTGSTASLGANDITNNGTLVFNSNSDLNLGGTLSGIGNLTKTGSGTLTVGTLSSTGGFTIHDGELATNSSINDQAVSITGASSVLSHSSSFKTVGLEASGSISVSNGGTLTNTSTSSLSYLYLGRNSGSSGTLTVNGANSSLTWGSRLRTGYNGTGILNLEAGGTATFNHTSDSYVGQLSTGVGTVNLSGTGSTLTTGGRLIVGDAGTGTVNIGSGSTLSANRVQLAQDTGSFGTLNLNTGGTLIVSDANGTAIESGSGTATVNFAGGTLKSNGTSALTVSSNATLANGTTSTVDTNGQTGTFSGILSGSGALTKSGAGTLTLSAANTYTGATTISTGTLALDATGTITTSSGINLGTTGSTGTLDVTAKSSFTIGSGQTLSGVGTVALGGNTLTLASGATLAPGNSAGLVTVGGDFTLNSASIISLELGGLTRGTSYDAFDVTGALNLGGTLNIALINSFSPSETVTFTLFSSSTSIGGTFAAVNLPTVSGGTWNTTNLASSGQLSYTASAVPEPASFAILFALAALGFTATRRRQT